MPLQVRSDMKLLGCIQAVAVQLPCHCWSRTAKLSGAAPIPLPCTQGLTPGSFKPEKQGWGEKLPYFIAIFIGLNCVNVVSCCLHLYVYGWVWATLNEGVWFSRRESSGHMYITWCSWMTAPSESPLCMGEKSSRVKGSPSAQGISLTCYTPPVTAIALHSWVKLGSLQRSVCSGV